MGVDGADIYTELRGSGAAVLIVGAADEDAEIYRGVAERLATSHRVLTYDRRGTGRSSGEGWPSDSTRHADDAAALVENLDLVDVTVLGASAGGIVALRLALRHPGRLKTVLCFEPGVFEAAEGGDEFRLGAEQAVETHLRSHPGDWPGAAEALGEAAVSLVRDMTSLFTPPPGKEWFAARMSSEAESLIRGDLPLTADINVTSLVDVACPVNLRFSHGTASLPIFGDIARNLAAMRGEEPDALEGLGHGICYHPDQAVQYVSYWT